MGIDDVEILVVLMAILGGLSTAVVGAVWAWLAVMEWLMSPDRSVDTLGAPTPEVALADARAWRVEGPSPAVRPPYRYGVGRRGSRR